MDSLEYSIDVARLKRTVQNSELRIDIVGSILDDEPESSLATHQGRAERHEYVYFLAAKSVIPHERNDSDERRAQKLLR